MPAHPAPARPVPDSWTAPRRSGPVRASVRVPGSKSLTNRFLVLAALADDDSVIRHPLDSRDTRLMIGALRSLGAAVDDSDQQHLVVSPVPAGATAADGTVPTVDCGLAGTVMRFVPPLAAGLGSRVRFDGDPEARVRPMDTVLGALRSLHVTVTGDQDATAGEPDTLPFDLDARAGVRGGHLDIDASASSQFVSGLLLAGCAFDLGLDLRHTGALLPSRPHIDMTLEVLADAGVLVEEPEPHHWVVEPGRPRGLDVVVEPDLSNAATFLAAALVTGGTVHVPDWPVHTTQAGDAFRDIAQAFGGSWELDGRGLTVTGPDVLVAVDLDLGAVGELTPVVAAVAACARGTSKLRGIGHLRGHETDRLEALRAELTGAGAEVEAGDDHLVIHSPAQHGHRWRTYKDHRMVMAGAVLGLAVDGIVLDDPGTVAKTLPQFLDLWEDMVAQDTGGEDLRGGGAR
ncbi:3-phosphoshikimate 1-carboxyvinyltransferase [Brevibacterium litoralis]|uniref:3-phosphoshikimate 1-carboxyvinyltransferase n=1 Tax=Brevibacterium litoralis TaxID=3138935 RepID=UPI0032EAB6CE